MLESAAFRIPVARDRRGRLVAPEEAERGCAYSCPACEGAVDLHAGERKRRHYHHRASACSPETVLHLSAKALIVQAVDEWVAGGPAPVFVRRCACPVGCEATCRQRMPKKIVRAAPELALATGHVVDVGLLGRADLPVAAIEILFSHAVDDDKARELGLPWIEVDAAQVCDDRGRVLVPVRDRFLPWLCAEHEGHRGQAVREDRAERRAIARIVRELPYRIEEFAGLRVDGLTSCPNGHETLIFAWNGREPPWPRPPHVVAVARGADVLFDAATRKLRSTLPFRRAWASACVRCGARVTISS